ncbi:hypothetical protein KVP40.0204 [Vibrio phage KVP40]|uniref:Uncharacterized protein n=1 Tax=Vibrio phage KVP40 (isolate Vibrio parahaemolyticus/Japan/Matsuzaki/1991) TaxID=75320 RepID=Q6WHV0_BPKVM|nr:hypothetical protein KVP40.0204 [Vibrio phage KVP40]AAQ64273.1 hypothetical protein KVP40.0204 [Vibrio phage KVP40]
MKEWLFPTITPPSIGDKFRQTEKDWVDTEREATIIEVTNVSKDGKYVKYEFTQIEGKPVVQSLSLSSYSSTSTYEIPTQHLYRLFEKVE